MLGVNVKDHSGVILSCPRSVFWTWLVLWCKPWLLLLKEVIQLLLKSEVLSAALALWSYSCALGRTSKQYLVGEHRGFTCQPVVLNTCHQDTVCAKIPENTGSMAFSAISNKNGTKMNVSLQVQRAVEISYHPFFMQHTIRKDIIFWWSDYEVRIQEEVSNWGSKEKKKRKSITLHIVIWMVLCLMFVLLPVIQRCPVQLAGQLHSLIVFCSEKTWELLEGKCRTKCSSALSLGGAP